MPASPLERGRRPHGHEPGPGPGEGEGGEEGQPGQPRPREEEEPALRPLLPERPPERPPPPGEDQGEGDLQVVGEVVRVDEGAAQAVVGPELRSPDRAHAADPAGGAVEDLAEGREHHRHGDRAPPRPPRPGQGADGQGRGQGGEDEGGPPARPRGEAEGGGGGGIRRAGLNGGVRRWTRQGGLSRLTRQGGLSRLTRQGGLSRLGHPGVLGGEDLHEARGQRSALERAVERQHQETGGGHRHLAQRGEPPRPRRGEQYRQPEQHREGGLEEGGARGGHAAERPGGPEEDQGDARRHPAAVPYDRTARGHVSAVDRPAREGRVDGAWWRFGSLHGSWTIS